MGKHEKGVGIAGRRALMHKYQKQYQKGKRGIVCGQLDDTIQRKENKEIHVL